MRIRRRQYAFTILEMLLVVALMVLAAGIGGGIYIGSYKSMLVKKSARDFLMTAKYARVLAIERQCPVSVRLDEKNSGFWLSTYMLDEETGKAKQVIVRDFYSKPMRFGGDVKFQKIQIARSGAIEAALRGGEGTIVFSPDGTAQTAMIKIGDGEDNYTVSIAAGTGKAQLHAGNVEKAKFGTVDLDR